MKLIPGKSLLAASATGLLALAAVLPARADYSNTVMSLNPIGYWRLNDAVVIPKDMATNSGSLLGVGNGVYSAATHPVSGALVGSSDTAASFAGGNVTIPWNAALNPAGAFSVECWANSTAAASGNHTLVQSWVQGQNLTNSNDRSGWLLREVGADLQLVLGSLGAPSPGVSDPYIYYTVSNVVSAGVWEHFVVTYDGTSISVYTNGSLAAPVVAKSSDGVTLTPDQIALIRVTPNPVGTTIIGDRGYGGWTFNGKIDEVAIYASALSAQDVLNHYNNGLSASPSQPYDQLVQASSPVGYWRLNEPTFVFVPPVAPNLGSWGPTLNGAYQSTVTPRVAGPPYAGFGANNYASYFNNTFNSYVNIPAQTNVSISTVQSLTVTAWIKRNGQGIYWNMVYSHPRYPGYTNVADYTADNPPAGPNLHNSIPVTGIGFNNTGPYNQLDGYYNGTGNNTGAYGSTANPVLAVPDTNWTFVAMVVDGAQNMVMYMNDQSATNNTIYGAHDFSTCDALIGRKQQLYGFGGSEVSGFLGSIAEVAIFDQALSKDQVMQIYSAAAIAPTITQQPQPAKALAGGLAQFTVKAAGSPPFSYQWFFIPAGTTTTNTLTDATNSSYAIFGVTAVDAGSYFVQVTSPYGTIKSADAALSLKTPSAYNTAVLALNPAGYWPLDDSAGLAANLGTWGTNAIGAYYAATNLVPGVPYPGFGTNHYGAAFRGVNGTKTTTIGHPEPPGSCVEIPAQTGIFSDITITCWIKRRIDQAPWRGLVAQRDQTTGRQGEGLGTGITLDGGPGLCVDWNKSDVWWQWGTGLSTPLAQWAFCAVVFTPTNRTVYLNTQTASRTVTQPEINTAGITYTVSPEHDWSVNPIFIGLDPRGPYFGNENNAFDGSMNEVAIFNRALTTNEMLQIYAAAQVPPIILVQPVAPTPPIYEGMSLSLSVTADAYATATPLGYQWTKNGLPIAGQKGTNYTVSVLATNDTGNYAVVITNAAGATTSSIVALTVLAGPPIFVQKPQAVTRYAGAPVTFTTVVNGSRPLYYQWNFNNNPILGATNSTYTINQVGTGDAGSYSVTASNPYPPATNSGNVTLTVLTVTGYGAEVVASGPASYWRFNETSGTNAYDYVGGVTGTNVGIVFTTGPNASSSITGPFNGMEANNGAYTFNGSSSVVNLPKPFALNGSAYSVVAWVRGLSGATTNRVIMGQAGSWSMRLDSGSFISLELANGPSTTALPGVKFIADDYWHQAVAVYDGATEYLYVDGVLDASKAASGLITTNANIVTIGWQGGTTPRWNGDLDEVAVYNRALTAGEIADLYQIATAGTTAPTFATQPVSQTAYPGQPVTFSVVASGGAPYTYQWQHAGTNLPGATAKTLTIPSVWYTDAGTYSVAVNNTMGPVTNSDLVSLTVLMPVPTFGNLTDQLVLHLAFQNGGYADSSGRGNDASPVGTPTFAASPVGPAVHLGRSANAYLIVSDLRGDLSFGAADSFTVAFWLRYTVSFYDLPIIGNARNSTYNAGWVITENAGKLDWTAVGGASVIRDPAYSVGPLMNDGQWHNVVVAFDRTAAQAYSYVDGGLVDTASIAGLGGLVTTSPLILGNDVTGVYGSGAFDVGDVGIWRRALSPTEVTSILNTNGPPVLTLVPPSASNGQSIELIWQSGTLLQSTNVDRDYLPVSGATAPYYKVTPGAGSKFYRIQY